MLNLTKHLIEVRVGDAVYRFPPSGTIAMVSTTDVVVGTVDGIPVVATEYGEVTGLPEEGTPCLVSAVVANAVKGRKGVYSPDTGPTAIRNSAGLVDAVIRLRRA